MIRVLGLLLSGVLLPVGAIDLNALGQAARTSAQIAPRVGTSSKCEATGTITIRIDCVYSVPPGNPSDKSDEPRILLDHAVIAFEPVHESHMRIELSFTNHGAAVLAESRTVYIAFDDEAGENHIRRPLPHVDFRKLIQGESITFTDQFLAPALTPGRYFVRLWIPDSNPTLKFDPAHNYLLDNEGMAESSSRLNRIATVLVEKAIATGHASDH